MIDMYKQIPTYMPLLRTACLLISEKKPTCALYRVISAPCLLGTLEYELGEKMWSWNIFFICVGWNIFIKKNKDVLNDD